MTARKLPEMATLERIIDEGRSFLSVRRLCDVESDEQCFPIYALSLGGAGMDLPGVGFFGGVHGLERIGTHVLLAFLHSLIVRMKWDAVLRSHLTNVRLVFMPLVNPAGMWRASRCNPQGVDLMRNAPVNASEKVPFLIGGHRISSNLPWFRGQENQPMQPESQALCQVVHEELLSRPFSIALDCHSGFGLHDRIWFPYAHTKTPIRHLPEVLALEELFYQTYPNHDYMFEPQSRNYLTHGDLWDHLYLQASAHRSHVFLPFTLEMGSWRWIKKNPWQLFYRAGFFNPLPLHRRQRVLRRHLHWLEFLTIAACEYQRWLPDGPMRAEKQSQAHERWYWKENS